MQWDKETRTLSMRVPHWAEVLAGLRRRHWARFLLFVIMLDLCMGYLDQPLAEWIKSNITGGILWLCTVLTQLGDSKYWLVPVAFLLPFCIAAWQAVGDRSTRRMIGWVIASLVFMFACIAFSGILINILKPIFGRARPELWFDNGYYGFLPLGMGDGSGSEYRSFPSGHAATIFAATTALSFFLPKRLRLWFVALAAVPVTLSRVVISAHYLSDVVAGGAIGWWVTQHLRDFFMNNGWVFVFRGGECRVRAPGQLLFSRLAAMLPQTKEVTAHLDDDELLVSGGAITKEGREEEQDFSSDDMTSGSRKASDASS